MSKLNQRMHHSRMIQMPAIEDDDGGTDTTATRNEERKQGKQHKKQRQHDRQRCIAVRNQFPFRLLLLLLLLAAACRFLPFHAYRYRSLNERRQQRTSLCEWNFIFHQRNGNSSKSSHNQRQNDYFFACKIPMNVNVNRTKWKSISSVSSHVITDEINLIVAVALFHLTAGCRRSAVEMTDKWMSFRCSKLNTNYAYEND